MNLNAYHDDNGGQIVIVKGTASFDEARKFAALELGVLFPGGYSTNWVNDHIEFTTALPLDRGFLDDAWDSWPYHSPEARFARDKARDEVLG